MNNLTHRVFFLLLSTSLLLAVTFVDTAHADDASDASSVEKDRAAMQAAVALNYCRASIHRIRENPSKMVLMQEQQKILDNLNLQSINDAEVIGLYTAVLDEISQVDIAERERKMFEEHHGGQMQRKLTWDAIAFGTSLATAQVGSAIKTGADSWWDYRDMEYKKENDLLRIDKQQMQGVVKKSTQFLDTCWTMAQKRDIPDRWMIRGSDLDRLSEAMNEEDPAIRLRVLQRMEPLMEAYPPYWYYVARTEQSLGEMQAAAATYLRMADLGDGHFRTDDMLACGLANLAGILEQQGDGDALRTAERALAQSTDVWEANLMCARVLERHGATADAEDAIYRNLDVGLERRQSETFRISLYYHSGQKQKLADALEDPQTIALLPSHVLLRCVALLGPEQTPQPVAERVLASLSAQTSLRFGRDEFIVEAHPAWQLHLATISACDGQITLPRPTLYAQASRQLLRFPASSDWGNPIQSAQSQEVPHQVTMTLHYPDETTLNLVLAPKQSDSSGSFNVGPASLRRSMTATAWTIQRIDIDRRQLTVSSDESRRPILISLNSDAPVSDAPGSISPKGDVRKSRDGLVPTQFTVPDESTPAVAPF